jgi:phenylacetate-CoA ligase
MITHNAYGYGLFTGGLGFHMGAERLGCLVIPVSGGMTARQIMLLQDLRADVLFATPSYALNIAEHMKEAGINPESLTLRIAICGAEPWTEGMRLEIERSLKVKAMNMYGLSEIVGPGVAAECLEAQSGSHIQEDHFLPEIIDPDTDESLAAGVTGELVFTTLTKEGMPVVRYRTGDIASLDASPCVCGRTTIRMSRVVGRLDDMLIIRGVNLYPSEVERILLSTGEVAPHYQLMVDRPGTTDELTVLCEPAGDEVEEADRADLRLRLERVLLAETGITIAVKVLPRGSVPRSEGKAVRVVDRRTV